MRTRGLSARQRPPAAVLFDRDGTLIYDVPNNRDPARVVAMPGAALALRRLRAAEIPTAVITNQSAVAAGAISLGDVATINERMEAMLGPLGPILICPHGADEGCRCRKPHPALVLDAARALGVDAADCIVIGDIGSDMQAAHNAGARAILVPTPVTLAAEIAAASTVAQSLEEAVAEVLAARA